MFSVTVRTETIGIITSWIIWALGRFRGPFVYKTGFTRHIIIRHTITFVGRRLYSCVVLYEVSTGFFVFFFLTFILLKISFTDVNFSRHTSTVTTTITAMAIIIMTTVIIVMITIIIKHRRLAEHSLSPWHEHLRGLDDLIGRRRRR